MKTIWNSAVGLLVITGALLGLTLPFGKMAGAAGVAPSLWALVISLVWIYYATVVFFVGALMTAVIDERLRARGHLAQAGIPCPKPGETTGNG